ncbi:hypothetical protein [Paenibacillus paeoniae]|uniref:Lipoprotein n=1 Tax=Paenibacillus paeoniae TaxID=2292705 RepID=A0A371PGF8_9BACL|nr:hypothetical protein [Paenibacillus paeoniae]REK74965.1 hypothetical protein DX130_15085 [Paenibacillus paeoniae]
MNYRNRIVRTGMGVLAALIMLSGCGAAKPEGGDAASFGDAIVYADGESAAGANGDAGDAFKSDSDEHASGSDEPPANEGDEQVGSTQPGKDEIQTNGSAEDAVDDGKKNSSADTETGAKHAGEGKSQDAEGSDVKAPADSKPGSGHSTQADVNPGNKTNAGTANQGTTGKADESAGKGAGTAGKPGSANGTKGEQSVKSGGTSSSKFAQIGWNDFFDNGDQTTPSDRFWDLSEERKSVQIKGFMGEVLSFNQNWFLLIPEPGAECPFDNGDETYWNKIMIVFVKDGSKLRYTSKPLKLTGRLDVGVKVDESGYKTMFRLYDAKFEEIKE